MSEGDSFEVEILLDSKAQLAEGPHWLGATSELLWVDILGKTVNFFNCGSSKNTAFHTEDVVTAAIPCRDNPDTFVITIGRKLAFFDRRSGLTKDIVQIEHDKEDNRCNDAKCDPRGRLWFGTMGPEPVPTQPVPYRGSFYSYTPTAGVKTHFEPVSISNGIGWSLDHKTMYYVDSFPKKVYMFDYDVESGLIDNNRVLLNFCDVKEDGFPDGMTVDSDGNLWIASYLSAAVLKVSPEGDILTRVTFPAARITSCCFGGPDYQHLFVTSASTHAEPNELEAFPKAGALFVVKNTGVTGLPAWDFN